ncbi:MAG TPA: 30S ribosome-binding factor RbfA [Terriglobales bacterium]|jgi:ribosome-binding factor A|nr:30S ribosome-binding factor RbfA [Terriglobales bacterium]HET7872582.1 30S ribosome-binding factor RbfA [Terriglobales bacterium]
MPEQRSHKHHRERLGEALREEIETILEGELGDPRIGLANVTEVQLAADGKSAHVLVVVQGGEQEAQQTLAGLAAARGFIRHELAERMQRRHAPELFFALDKSQQYEARIDQLLKRIKPNKK